ncbi:MAG: NAD(P)/FAD-dependent oxidoreductase, partial [Alphaproteobacteria bacterium]
MSTKGEADFDVVIVGASFAGLVAARTAAMRGLRVAVVERKADPGAEPHTTGILVKEAADALDIPSELTRRVHGVRLYSPAMHHIDLDTPGYYFLATDTPGL